MKRYKVLKQLGKGVFGVVVKALDIEKSQIVAIKVMKKSKNSKEQFERETETLKFLNKIDHN